MIERDHTIATYVASGCLALGLVFSCAPTLARGAETRTLQAPAAQSIVVSLVTDSEEAAYPTRARTVGGFLQERNIALSPDDYVSASLDSEIKDGARVEYRRAIPLELRVGSRRVALRSSAPTVAALLAAQDIVLGADDEITPSLESPLNAGSIVRIVRVSRITTTTVSRISPPLQRRADAHLPIGKSRTLDAGLSGLRETTISVETRDDGTPSRTLRYARLVRPPHAKIVAFGTARPAKLMELARASLLAAGRIANSALNVIATAYTAGCYGCSGITALGQRAGHGIVAVDPRVIPLGTKLYVPGYGRAVAGDTGGDIHGRRIDLGFNSLAEATRFGRREITVYVLR